MIDEKLSEDEIKFVYQNNKGKYIYTPLYRKYKEYFFEDVISKTRIKTAFKEMKNTAIYERYMLNAAQFSAAKSASEVKMLQAAVFDENKKVKSPSQFKNDAKAITEISQETWLRVERDMCVRQAVQLDAFSRMMEDSDLYPYWVYKGVMDDRERDEHVALEDLVFKIGDPAGDAIYPPDDWNCRCSGEAIDEDELSEKGYKLVGNTEAKQLLDTYVDEQFRYNAAVQGTMPNTGSYFDVLNSANAANSKTFGLEDIESDEELDGLGSKLFAATGLHYLIEKVNDWRDAYYVNKNGDIVFQNNDLYSNVKFNNNLFMQYKSILEDLKIFRLLLLIPMRFGVYGRMQVNKK